VRKVWEDVERGLSSGVTLLLLSAQPMLLL
jgi:hypothetical protein